jgi:hypothetical protein
MAYADMPIAYLHIKSNIPRVNDSLIAAMKLKTVFIILNIMRSSMIILLSKHPLYGQ